MKGRKSTRKILDKRMQKINEEKMLSEIPSSADEKLNKISVDIATIKANVTENRDDLKFIRKELFGNGDMGLVSTVRELNTDYSIHKANLKTCIKVGIPALIAVVAIIVTILVT